MYGIRSYAVFRWCLENCRQQNWSHSTGRWNLANTIDSGGDVAAPGSTWPDHWKNTLFLLYSVSREQIAHLCFFFLLSDAAGLYLNAALEGVAVISQGLSADSAEDPAGVDVWPLSQSVSVLFVAGGQHLSSSHLNHRLTAAIRVLTARQATQNRGGKTTQTCACKENSRVALFFIPWWGEAFFLPTVLVKRKEKGFGHLMHW